MRAYLRKLDCAELDDAVLRDYMPEDPSYFAIRVDAYIGPSDTGGEDLFYFLVRSPRWLAVELQQGRYAFGRNYVILPRFDYQLLWNAIKDLCESIEGPDWETVARRIGRYGLWEYDDYYGPPGWKGQHSRPKGAGGSP